MILFNGIISGLLATILFDLYNYSLNFAYGIDKPKWNLLGRYFLGYKENKFIRKNLIEDEEIENELLWGYIFHYIIGLIYGIVFVILNFLLFDYPSIFLAYIFGFITVIGGWCFLMPFAYMENNFHNQTLHCFHIKKLQFFLHLLFL